MHHYFTLTAVDQLLSVYIINNNPHGLDEDDSHDEEENGFFSSDGADDAMDGIQAPQCCT